jgi:hypothetical protein
MSDRRDASPCRIWALDAIQQAANPSTAVIRQDFQGAELSWYLGRRLYLRCDSTELSALGFFA